MAMLTLQRRHTATCKHRSKGPDFLKCNCPIRACGSIDGKRTRLSLRTRDLSRASRRLAELSEPKQQPEAVPEKPRKLVEEAVAAFLAQRSDKQPETLRKYKRILKSIADFGVERSLSFLDQFTIDELDAYVLRRRPKLGEWTWNKEVEVLRQFFRFCFRRHWIEENPATDIKAPKPEVANEAIPYTREEIARILEAANTFGQHPYERLRARAMLLVLRHTGLRISDVVTLSRDHIHGRYLVKQAIKNKRVIRIELPQHVLDALAEVPLPKAASADCRLFFGSGNSSLRSLVKGAERTLAAVFERSGVSGAYPHRFRHTLASEILGEGGTTVEDAANVLGDDPAIVRRHYAKWIPAIQSRQDSILRKIHGTYLAQTEEQAVPL